MQNGADFEFGEMVGQFNSSKSLSTKAMHPRRSDNFEMINVHLLISFWCAQKSITKVKKKPTWIQGVSGSSRIWSIVERV